MVPLVTAVKEVVAASVARKAPPVMVVAPEYVLPLLKYHVPTAALVTDSAPPLGLSMSCRPISLSLNELPCRVSVRAPEPLKATGAVLLKTSAASLATDVVARSLP